MLTTLKTMLARRNASAAGRALVRESEVQRKLRIRAKCEQMCRDMGKPAPKWGKL